NDDDKDHDTRVQIDVASLASGISVGTPFRDGSENVVTLALYKTPTPMENVTGKLITICIYPNGHDTWRFNYSLVVKLEEGSSRAFVQNGLTLSQNSPCSKATVKF